MKSYKPYQVAIIAAFCVFANSFGKMLSNTFNLPLWLDSFGTILISYVLGPFCGIIVGISPYILYSLYTPSYIVYSISGASIALIVGFLAKRGWLESLLKAMSLSVLLTLSCVITSSTMNLFVFDGKIHNIWGDGMVDFLETFSLPFALRVVIGQFYVDFLDKVILTCALFYFIRIYRALKARLPRFLKMNIIVFSSVFFFICFLPTTVFAEEKNFNSYVRTAYGSENGIPCGEANDIASTNDGVMWIGTYAGLYRHNGTEFRLMNDFKTIRAVKCLYVDDEGRLFVGTNDNGLSIVINETVANVLEEKDGLPSDSVRCVTRGSDGFYYVGTAQELAIISIVDGLAVKALIPEILDAVRVSADASDRIAAVTSAGELFIIQNKKVVWKSDISKNKFTSAAFGEDGLLYASTEKNMLLGLELSGNPVKIVEAIHETECGGLTHINSIDFADNVAFLSADNGVGYVKNGIFHDIETGTFNNSIDHMTQDYQGNLWFSSSRLGLLKMSDSVFAEIYNSAGLESTVINSTLLYQGNMYFATDNGLSMKDNESGYKSENILTEFLKNTRVRCLFADKEGFMWIATKSRGVLKFDGESIKQFANGNHFRTIIELSDKTIAVGGNNGVIFIKDDEIVESLSEEDGFENPTVLCLCELKNDKLLCGTDGGGIAVISKNIYKKREIEKIIKKTSGLSSNVILRLVNDLKSTDDSIFAVTSNALCYIKHESYVGGNVSDLFDINILDNFPYYNNFDIVQNADDIFVLGSAGIFVVSREELLSGKKLDYELFDLKKGLRGSLTANSWNYIDKKGNLYLSCNSGACRFNISTYDKNEQSYRMQLKSVLIDGKRHIVQKDIPFAVPSESETLEIVPEIINYSINNPYVSVYLEGIDEKPTIMLQSEVSSTVYTHIEAGTYRFHIAVLDSKGRNITEEAVYEIKKVHRFYNNWYFMLYAIGVFMLAVAWLTWFLTSAILRRRLSKQEAEMNIIKNQVRMGNETIFAIAAAVEARDKSTGRHSARVAEYSVLIAEELGFSSEELEGIRRTGLLHDIGKIGVPDSILNKPASLTDEEYKIMKTHVEIGGEILKNFTLIENVADGAKYHHEHYDGSGYPNGLKGEAIPLNARIIGLADAFDAMTATRIYRKALDIDFVLQEIKRNSGTQFDPALAEIMIELVESGKLNINDIFSKSQ